MERIKKYFKNKDSYNNVIKIYNELKRTKQIELLRIFKAIVYCGCANKDFDTYLTIDDYFSPHMSINGFGYSINKVKKHLEYYRKVGDRCLFFGSKVKDYLGKY